MKCGENVFASKSNCFKCGAPKDGFKDHRDGGNSAGDAPNGDHNHDGKD